MRVRYKIVHSVYNGLYIHKSCPKPLCTYNKYCLFDSFSKFIVKRYVYSRNFVSQAIDMGLIYQRIL